MSWSIDVAIAKVSKHASRESGDTAELVERPRGGLSLVVIDGQGSGRSAKSLSMMLSARAVSLLKDGVRDGAVARAVHDFLFSFRNGQVSASLDILSVDLLTKSVVVTRNSATPLLIGRAGRYEIAPCAAEPIGLYARTRPVVWEVPFEDYLQVVVCTDGIETAGRRSGLANWNLADFASGRFGAHASASVLADGTLAAALDRDQARPADDMTVMAAMLRSQEAGTQVRRLTASMDQP